VESLDDVIDAMIADRVIHRHRRKWLIVIALVVVVALVVLATGGWTQKKGRTVPTLTAPTTVESGEWEYNFTATEAEIRRKPKTKYSEAEAKLRVYFDLKNNDSEEHTSKYLDGRLVRMVPGGGKDLVESNGADCRGELGWVLVYGLPPESCYTEFDVAPDFAEEVVELGILGNRYESDNGLLGADEDPYWHNPVPDAVVRVKTKVVVDGEDE